MRNSARDIKKLEQYRSNSAVDLWAVDEVHFQQYGSRCRMWIPPEMKDPVSLHHPTRKSVGYFGAVRLRDGKFVYKREEGKFNADSFFSFLRYLRKLSAPARRKVVLIIDNARYHHARLHKEWRQKICEDFMLEFLPPYSPDLNPIERAWKLVRRKALHNRYFPTLQHVVIEVEILFREWEWGSSTLRRLCAIS
jgi:transposase